MSEKTHQELNFGSFVSKYDGFVCFIFTIVSMIIYPNNYEQPGFQYFLNPNNFYAFHNN